MKSIEVIKELIEAMHIVELSQAKEKNHDTSRTIIRRSVPNSHVQDRDEKTTKL